MKAAVNKMIHTVFPFVKWMGKIMKITVIIITLSVIITIIFMLWSYCYVNQQKIKIKNNIAQFISSLDRGNKTNDRRDNTTRPE